MSTAGLSLAHANNFMALEQPLLQLLRDAVQGRKPAVHVLSAADLAEVKEAAQKTPALHLIYAGFAVVEDMGTAWRLEHTWYAVAAVRNVAAVRSGQAARQEAGPLVTLAVAALAGSKPAGATKALKLITPPKPRYTAGYQYIPSAFLAETIFRKP